MYKDGTPVPLTTKGCMKTTKLLWVLASSDDEDDLLAVGTTSTTPDPPWLKEFNMYIDSLETLPAGMSLTTFWGVSPMYIIYFELY